MTVALSEVEQRMRPGGWFPDGFLLEDTSLDVVLADDANALALLDVTAQQIGQKLSELLELGGKSDWFWPFRSGEFKVEIRRRRGLITCPWAPEEFEPCAVGQLSRPTADQFSIARKGSNQRLEGFELSCHLIRDHAFFGGRGTRFRVEPELAVSVLGIK